MKQIDINNGYKMFMIDLAFCDIVPFKICLVYYKKRVLFTTASSSILYEYYLF